MYVVDSNIWAYYFDKTLPEHAQVVSFMDKIIKKREIVVTNIILLEVTHFLFKRLGEIEGYNKSKIFQLGDFHRLDFTSDDLDEQLALMKSSSKSGLGGRDISIIVCMNKNKLTRIVTHDKAFKKLKDIEAIDPILNTSTF